MKLTKITLFAACLTATHLFSGSDFVALLLNQDAQNGMKNVQAYVAKKLKGTGVTFNPAPPENLHITLKEIGDIQNSKALRDAYTPYLTQAAGAFKSFWIESAIRDGKLVFTKKGLVKLRLAPYEPLTKLAVHVQNALNKAHKDGVLPSLLERFDFPNEAHITLGHIDFNRKTFNDLLPKFKHIGKNFDPFKAKISVEMNIKQFDLLWSNSPQLPRQYITKRVFYLKP